ncbi:hypothetical protein [Aurantivibrio infirmus]
MKSIFRIDIEVAHMEGTQLPMDCGGAFVSVYLREENIRAAMDSAESELLTDLYKPKEITAAYQIDEDEFEELEEEEGYPNEKDFRNLLLNGGVWYGPFHLFPAESHEIN